MSLLTESVPESICVLRLSAIGDCCHTLPVIRSIQAAWPETKITWIIGRTEFSLMQGVENVEFVIFDKSHGFKGLLDVRRKLSGRHFPLLLHMHASMRANLVSRMISADVRLGFDRQRARDYQWLFTNRQIPPRLHQHVMDGLFGFTECLGLKDRVVRWGIPLSASYREVADSAVDGSRDSVCVISPCTSQRLRNYRNWRVENFAAVIRHFQAVYGGKIILTGASTDIEQRYGNEIESLTDGAVTNLVGQTTLKQLSAVLARADLLICPDSGPAHMATAVGTPVVGLYATSNPRRTGPYNSQELVVDRYPKAIRREFSKPVDAVRWGQRVRDPDSMDLITVEDVNKKIDLVLGSGRLSDAGQ